MNNTWISTILVNLIISIIISTILFLLILYNKVSPLNLIHFIITFILFYKSSHLTFAFDHGYYNFVGFFALLWVFIMTGLIFHGIFLLLRSRYRYIFFIFAFLSFLLPIVN